MFDSGGAILGPSAATAEVAIENSKARDKHRIVIDSNRKERISSKGLIMVVLDLTAIT